MATSQTLYPKPQNSAPSTLGWAKGGASYPVRAGTRGSRRRSRQSRRSHFLLVFGALALGVLGLVFEAFGFKVLGLGLQGLGFGGLGFKL